jgi:hypothetical protein
VLGGDWRRAWSRCRSPVTGTRSTGATRRRWPAQVLTPAKPTCAKSINVVGPNQPRSRSREGGPDPLPETIVQLAPALRVKPRDLRAGIESPLVQAPAWRLDRPSARRSPSPCISSGGSLALIARASRYRPRARSRRAGATCPPSRYGKN